ncbi:LiaF transmembrane domain-containing protein [Marinilabilia sp.]|jgi:predicted membrane protein
MDQNQEIKKRRHHHSLVGITLVIAGIVFLAGNLGMIPHELWDLIARWPTIFLIFAFVNLGKKKFIPAIIFVAIWLFFVFPDVFPDVRTDEIWNYWPVLLILAGLLFLYNNQKRRYLTSSKQRVQDEDIIEEVAIFSGNMKRIESQNFKGGEITSIFGGTELYFNNSKLAPEGASIELANIFGGTKIVVPREWNVRIKVVSILGGFADKRVYTDEENNTKPILTLKGVSIFGGGEISNF